MIVEKAFPYWVDGEVGRFEFTTHQLCEGDETLYDTAVENFPPRGRWEWYKTSGFKEIAYIYGVAEQSYRKTSRLINRLRYQSEHDGTPSRSLNAQAEGEDERLTATLDRKATQILTTHHVQEEGGEYSGGPTLSKTHDPVMLAEEQVAEAIATCQARMTSLQDLRQNPVPYEAPETTVNLTIDDVGVKRQKTERGSPASEAHERAGEQVPSEESTPVMRTRKYAHTTVVHVEQQARTYVLTGHGIGHVLRLVVAFLLSNDLVSFRLQWFTDGYGILHAAIHRSLSWCSNVAIILDWYHLVEKCKIQLSLAMKGRVIRNAVLKELLPLLWHGLLEQAITFVKSLDREQVKNPEALTKLVGYFERNRAHIPCYAVRKELGLRNSSQIGEKMNDLLVSERQKHNGMSWSVSGSVSLAALAALGRNNEYARWFEEGDIAFQLVA